MKILLVKNVECFERAFKNNEKYGRILQMTHKTIPAGTQLKVGELVYMLINGKTVPVYPYKFLGTEGFVLKIDVKPSKKSEIPKNGPVVATLVGGKLK